MKEREMKRVDGTDYALWFEAVFRRRKELWVSDEVGKTDGRGRLAVQWWWWWWQERRAKRGAGPKQREGQGRRMEGETERERAPTTSPQQ